MALKSLQAAVQANVYSPLNEAEAEIRVLVVEAGESQDAVRCCLRVISLAEGRIPEYETISYCWGDATVRGAVLIEDIGIDVPASAEAALRATRSADHNKAVWIDALCINQEDVAEKGSQIASMDRVYQRGKHNNIYLGDDPGNVAKEHFDALRMLATTIRQDAPTSSDNEREEWTLRGYLPHAWVLMNSMARQDKDYMQRLLHLPWFKLWTMQEFALATDNICIWGQSRIDFSDFVVAAHFYVESLRSAPNDFDMEAGRRAAAVHSFMRLGEASRTTTGPFDFNLRNRYETITSRSASDPRDYVFGLVGLLKSWKRWRALPHLLQPDYGKSVEDVFRDATRAVLEMDGDGILEHIRFGSDADLRDARMPTWVVRWDTPSGKSQDLASGNSVALPPESNAGNGADNKNGIHLKQDMVDPDVLEVEGFFLDHIAWVSTPLQHIMSDLAFGNSHSLDELVQELVQQSERRPDNFFQLSRAEMAMLVLSGDRWDYGAHAFRTLRDAVQAFTSLKSFIETYKRLPHSDEGDCLSTGLQFYRMLQKYSRAFFLADGHVGLGPGISRIGDRLFIMDGGLFPYVLRACGEDWKVVGAALVHRAMHGEVFNMGIKPEWIRLR